jgi:O-antigen/teichoic acid export membrane protein
MAAKRTPDAEPDQLTSESIAPEESNSAQSRRIVEPISGLQSVLQTMPTVGIYMLCVFVDKIFSFITVPLMAIYVPPDEFGRFEVALSLIDFVGLVLSFRLADTMVRFSGSAEDNKEQQAAASELLGAGLLLALVFGIGVQLAAPRMSRLFSIDFDQFAMHWGLCAASVAGLMEMPLVWARFHDRAVFYLKFVIVRACLLAGSTVAMLTLGFGTAGIMTANAIIMLLSGAILLITLGNEVGVRASRRGFKRILVYGLPLVGAGVAQFALGNCSRLFLSGQVDNASLAYLGLASRLALASFLIYAPFSMWWGPRRFAVLRTSEGRETSAQMWSVGFSILLIGAAIVSHFGPLFIDYAMPVSYHPAGALIPLAALVQIVNNLCWLSNLGSAARDSGYQILRFDIAGAVTSLIGYATMLPWLGVRGALLAMLAGQTVRLGLYLTIGNRASGVVYPLKRAALAVAVAAVLLLLSPSDASGIARLGWSTISIIVLVWVLVSLHLFNQPVDRAWSMVRAWNGVK